VLRKALLDAGRVKLTQKVMTIVEDVDAEDGAKGNK
jgi:hypothetical protein